MSPCSHKILPVWVCEREKECVGVSERLGVRARVCACKREKERECVCVSNRGRVVVYVCMYETGREGDSSCAMLCVRQFVVVFSRSSVVCCQ